MGNSMRIRTLLYLDLFDFFQTSQPYSSTRVTYDSGFLALNLA